MLSWSRGQQASKRADPFHRVRNDKVVHRTQRGIMSNPHFGYQGFRSAGQILAPSLKPGAMQHTSFFLLAKVILTAMNACEKGHTYDREYMHAYVGVSISRISGTLRRAATIYSITSRRSGCITGWILCSFSRKRPFVVNMIITPHFLPFSAYKTRLSVVARGVVVGTVVDTALFFTQFATQQ